MYCCKSQIRQKAAEIKLCSIAIDHIYSYHLNVCKFAVRNKVILQGLYTKVGVPWHWLCPGYVSDTQSFATGM